MLCVRELTNGNDLPFSDFFVFLFGKLISFFDIPFLGDKFQIILDYIFSSTFSPTTITSI